MHRHSVTCFYCNLPFRNGATVLVAASGVSQSACVSCLVRSKWLQVCTVRTLFMNVRNRLGIPLWYTCYLVCSVSGTDVYLRARPTAKLMEAYLRSIPEYFRIRHAHKLLLCMLPILVDLRPIVWAFLYPKNIAV
jgi:hypothetical protein